MFFSFLLTSPAAYAFPWMADETSEAAWIIIEIWMIVVLDHIEAHFADRDARSGLFNRGCDGRTHWVFFINLLLMDRFSLHLALCGLSFKRSCFAGVLFTCAGAFVSSCRGSLSREGLSSRWNYPLGYCLLLICRCRGNLAPLSFCSSRSPSPTLALARFVKRGAAGN